jgi:8-oxo-dGTP pyrophosphatase MutT (NUDIX family)
VGDKWNGHVALPGGKRDPEDEDDQAAAAREALEEVGIDLSPENAIAVGNLPQRIVTTSWGKVPYVFTFNGYEIHVPELEKYHCKDSG